MCVISRGDEPSSLGKARKRYETGRNPGQEPDAHRAGAALYHAQALRRPELGQ